MLGCLCLVPLPKSLQLAAVQWVGPWPTPYIAHNLAKRYSATAGVLALAPKVHDLPPPPDMTGESGPRRWNDLRSTEYQLLMQVMAMAAIRTERSTE